MNPLKNWKIAVIGLGALAILLSAFFAFNSIRPSDSLIKGLVTKQMEKRLNGGTIVSMTLMRGESFSSQAHFSKVPYGTTLYPVVVHVVYNTKEKDGSISDNKDFSRTLNFYRSPTHQWVNDDELH